MIFHPGDAKNEFREFKVFYNTNELKTAFKIITPFFETGKGIKLGINKRKLKDILGKPDKVLKEKGIDIWRYEVRGSLYFGRYDFMDDHLIQIWFGESYP